MQMKLTDMLLRNLKPQAQRYMVWGDHGLGVRVSPKGKKSFIYLYRFKEKSRFLTLGDYPRMSLADAHKAHAEARKKLEQGIDPGAEAVAEREEERKAPTVATLADEYLEKWARPRKRSWREDERILQKDVLPVWGHRKAREITRRDVIRLLDEIVDRGAGIMANRTLAVIRKMFNFAVSRDIVPVSPCLAVRAPAPEQRRDRVLTTDEIRAFWHGLEGAKMAEGTKLALKLQLVTGQRKAEIVTAAWNEIDFTEKWWTIPAEKVKNRLPHRVPLSPLALELLQAAKNITSNSPWIFPSPRAGKHITPEAVDHALRRPGLEALGFSFVPHDLRRTAATFMTGSCGIPRLVVSKILNHAEPHITSIYDRASYDKEKQMALDAWARKLQAIVAGTESKVIPLIRGV
jgi:integrase